MLSFACGPTIVGDDVEDEEAARMVWVTTRDDVVPDIEEFLGPAFDDERRRLVESANGNSILVAHEAELETLGAFFHDRFHRCGGFATFSSLDEARHSITARQGDVAEPAEEPSLLVGEAQAINRMLPVIDSSRILATIMGLASFPTRYYTSTGGVSAANWLRDRWTELAAGRTDVTVQLFSHPGWAQPSVMMTIQGQDLSAEHVVIGGHLDSITFGGGNAPGADDDASGIATLTEVARVILADGVRLRRTVVFMAYAAEEVGLRGSNEIADQWAAEGRNVRGVMQLDMTNFQGTAGTDIVLFEDYTSQTLTDALETMAGTYLPTLVLSRDACGYACSDHASWFNNGFPTVLPFESQMDDYNSTIHTSSDTLSVSGNNATHATKFAKLALVWTIEQARVFGTTAPGGVRLAQVAYDVPGIDVLGEFVELYNTSTTAINVGRWTMTSVTTGRIRTIPAGTWVPAGGYLTLARDFDGFTALYGVPPDLARGVPPLPNGAAELQLKSSTGSLVDSVKWETTDWPLTAVTGKSLVRANPGGPDSNTASDWTVATAKPH